MISGETHYYQGRPYRLRVEESGRFPQVLIRNRSILVLQIPEKKTILRREQILQEWYREQLKQSIPRLLEKWQPILGVQIKEWGIKKMKTKWGSCNSAAKRIWLNPELAKKPQQCLEYLVVHELAHLIERKQSESSISIYGSHWDQF